jgi:hypothetical protein
MPTGEVKAQCRELTGNNFGEGPKEKAVKNCHASLQPRFTPFKIGREVDLDNGKQMTLFIQYAVYLSWLPDYP